MRFTLPEKTITLWNIRATAAAVLLGSVFVYLGVKISRFLFIGVAATLILWGVAVIFYIPRLIRSYKISVDENGITVSFGVILSTVQLCPATRFVYVSSAKTPLSRLFGLKGLSFFAAKARITVPEMSDGDADTVIGLIKAVNGE